MGMGKPSITEKGRDSTGAEESWQIQFPEISAKQCGRGSSVSFSSLRGRHDGFDESVSSIHRNALIYDLSSRS